MNRKNSITTVKVSLILLVILGACSKNGDLSKVNYGTSFGMCLGYCRNELTLEPGYVTYVHSGWVDTVETITCSDKLGNDDWVYYKTQLDVQEFLKLPATIGCPDCADGGAEWVEIELKNGTGHKVTFEWGNEPSVLNDYIIRLREQMDSSILCNGD